MFPKKCFQLCSVIALTMCPWDRLLKRYESVLNLDTSKDARKDSRKYLSLSPVIDLKTFGDNRPPIPSPVPPFHASGLSKLPCLAVPRLATSINCLW